ncbi:MAG: methyltransferase domain-containing protein, partial [Magnetococcales bacterium]|nr:methyltransferase domain-containing protein [Magnetococcales bacterium]
MHKLLEKILVCPGCHGALSRQGDRLICHLEACTASPRQWPIIDEKPVLFDESESLFRIADALSPPPSVPVRPGRRWLSKLWHARPGLSRNVAAEANFQQLSHLLRDIPDALVLVVGCGDEGDGIHHLYKLPNLTLVGLDVRWTRSVSLLADATRLPFADCSFDAIVLQGVLEHVLDLFQVEKEVFRTLKAQGLLYCELPFLQPNHGGAFDVTRFTWTGHRRYWRRFEQLQAGACCGPGMALAHMLQQFARALLPFRFWPIVSDWLTDWLFWWLKYGDGWLSRTPAGLDGASAFYFLGRKSAHPLSDPEILRTYRG